MKLVRKVNRVEIGSEYITLEGMLKFVGAVLSGGEAKHAIQAGEASVNGEPCFMRGKKLRPGDTVLFDNKLYEIV